jgi:hypothetical protein
MFFHKKQIDLTRQGEATKLAPCDGVLEREIAGVSRKNRYSPSPVRTGQQGSDGAKAKVGKS